jgi:apolipoprotein N-acyltransferase
LILLSRSFDRLKLPISLPLRVLLCMLAGAANVLAFAPFGWWPLQIGLLALLLCVATHEPKVRRNMLYGCTYGFGWFASGVYWLYISMHRYGGMPSWMAALAVALLALALAGLPAIGLGAATWLQRRWNASRTIALLLIFPAAWALAEWTRGWLFTGLPWVVSGYAHAVSPLAGFAPIVGVYGIGWIAALMAGCFALLPSKRLPVLVPIALFIAGFALQKIDWTTPHGKPISVRLLQGNVPQDMKFDSDQIYASLVLYRDMMVQAPADLIVTPETAITIFLSQLPTDFLSGLEQFAQRSNSHLAIGMPIMDGHNHYANSAVGIAPRASLSPSPSPASGRGEKTESQRDFQKDGRTFLYRYDKHHLVPFGEFIPYGFRWFVDMMNIPLGDFTQASTLQPPFKVKDQAVQPNICYEDLFGEEIAAQIRAGRAEGQGNGGSGPTILLNMSNIAWFGDSLALPQHLQISQMRSLETGRPMLRATNTGMTAVIDQKGRVVTQLPPLVRNSLAASVQGYDGVTPYVLAGNALFVALTALSLILAGVVRRKTPFPS